MKKLIFVDNEKGKEITEKEIRECDFLLNVKDLSDNVEDIMDGLIDIENVCSCISQSLNGDIEKVIEDLNFFWGYDLEIKEIY